jgi:hypothetical protein
VDHLCFVSSIAVTTLRCLSFFTLIDDKDNDEMNSKAWFSFGGLGAFSTGGVLSSDCCASQCLERNGLGRVYVHLVFAMHSPFVISPDSRSYPVVFKDDKST